GLVPAAEGSVLWGEEEILGLRPHEVLARGIARTFQTIRVLPSLTVLDNVLLGAHARLRSGPLGAVLCLPGTRREEAAARERALDAMALFGNRLTARAAQAAGALSYANRRPTEIARALLSRPGLLLLDEPTAGMNPAETRELAEQIRALHQAGLTVLLIEHKLDVVTQLADLVVVLDGGMKLAEGTPDAVRRDPEVLRAYLGRAAAAQMAAEAAHA
ncbi:MAG: ATP-binding cassette domain-containing protein, partial [Acetobacteraceae bacterium]|nr:ATP-binding cassette domain-containing protein [Acetobacteraceae bacterium]